VAGLFGRSNTHLEEVGHLAAGVHAIVKRRVGDSIAGLEPFLESSVLKAWQVWGPVGMSLTGSKMCWWTHTKERVDVVV